MAHEIFSVKLCELDEQIRRLHSRIHSSEFIRHSQLTEEIGALRKECAQAESMLRRELEFSQSEVVSRLSEAYGEIERTIRKMRDEINEQAEDNECEVSSAEEKILLAEYALDFAMQAANHALLMSMEAMDAQMTLQEKEERRLL